MSTPALRDKTLKFCTCSTCPSRGLTRGGGVFHFLFSPITNGRSWSTFPEKSHVTKNQVKIKKKPSGEVFAKAHRRRAQKFTVLIDKTAWTFAGEYICVSWREPACIKANSSPAGGATHHLLSPHIRDMFYSPPPHVSQQSTTKDCVPVFFAKYSCVHSIHTPRGW